MTEEAEYVVKMACNLGMLNEEQSISAWQDLLDKKGLARGVLRVMVWMRDNGYPVHRRSLRGLIIINRRSGMMFDEMTPCVTTQWKNGEIEYDMEELREEVIKVRTERPIYSTIEYVCLGMS